MRAKDFLLEYNRQITAQNYGERLYQTLRREGAASLQRLGINLGGEPVVSPETKQWTIDFILTALEETDPTPNKQYVQWIARIYIKGGTRLEDIRTQLGQTLREFESLKRRRLIQPPYNDINRYPDFQSLDQVVSQLALQHPDNEPATVDKGDAEEVYKDAQLRVINPKDQKAACYYGRGTKWCTAATTTYNAFSAYASKGPLYIIIPAQPKYAGEKYQFHFPDMQFMDEKDQAIQDLHGLVERYPQLMKLFGKEAKNKGVLQFFYSPNDIQTIVKVLVPKTKERLKSYLSANRQTLVRDISNELIKIFPEIKSMKEDLVDLVGDDVDHSFEYYFKAIEQGSLQNPAMLYNEDVFHDLIQSSGSVRVFSDNSSIFEFIQDILNLDDEEVNFEIDTTLNGELSYFYRKAFQKVWPVITRQYLKV